MSAGHARPRGDGSWELRWPQPKANGKRKTGTATIKAKSQREADRELAKRVAASLGGNNPTASAKLSFASYLDRWLPGHNCKEITRERYETNVRLYLKPQLGDVALRQLGTAHIRAAFQHWHNTGREGGKPLAKSSLNSIRQVLGAALTAAVVDELIIANPLVKLRNKLPTGSPPPVEVFAEAEVARILDIERDSAHHVCVVLCAAGGLRRAEAVGLKWKRLDLETGSVHVCETLNSLKTGLVWSTTKTEKERTLTLPDWAVVELRAVWRRNAEALLSIGIKLSPDHTVALHPEDGRPVHPVSFSAWCRRHNFFPHRLRHTHVSLLLQAGMSPAAVADRIGDTVKTLLQTYAHCMPNDDARAATVLQNAFGSARVAK